MIVSLMNHQWSIIDVLNRPGARQHDTTMSSKFFGIPTFIIIVSWHVMMWMLEFQNVGKMVIMDRPETGQLALCPACPWVSILNLKIKIAIGSHLSLIHAMMAIVTHQRQAFASARIWLSGAAADMTPRQPATVADGPPPARRKAELEPIRFWNAVGVHHPKNIVHACAREPRRFAQTPRGTLQIPRSIEERPLPSLMPPGLTGPGVPWCCAEFAMTGVLDDHRRGKPLRCSSPLRPSDMPCALLIRWSYRK